MQEDPRRLKLRSPRDFPAASDEAEPGEAVEDGPVTYLGERPRGPWDAVETAAWPRFPIEFPHVRAAHHATGGMFLTKTFALATELCHLYQCGDHIVTEKINSYIISISNKK